MNIQFAEINNALQARDVKRAEVAIARRLKANHTTHERATLLFLRAQTRLLAARPDDALEDLQNSINLQPERATMVESLILFGDIFLARFELAPLGFMERSDAETALTHYQQVIDNHPDHTRIGWAHYQIGRIYLSQNDTGTAAKHFQHVLNAPPEPSNIHAMACERIGFIDLFENRDAEKALAWFQKAQRAYPADDDPGWLIQLHMRISRAYLDTAEYAHALESARTALREIQNGTMHRAMLPDAHLAVAEVLAKMPGQETEAIDHYLRFLQSSKRSPGIDVTWSQVHETIGQLSFRLERYQQAIDAFEKALELNPDHPWEVHLRYQIARCFYRMRAYEDTITAIEKMQSIAERENTPITDWRVFNLQGNAYFALEQYGDAVNAYRSVIELAPPAAEALEKTRIYLRFSEELSQSSD